MELIELFESELTELFENKKVITVGCKYKV
jgi:hypothetical protein